MARWSLLLLLSLVTATPSVLVVSGLEGGPAHLGKIDVHTHELTAGHAQPKDKPWEDKQTLAGKTCTHLDAAAAAAKRRFLRKAAAQDLTGDELDAFLQRLLNDEVGSMPTADAATDSPVAAPSAAAEATDDGNTPAPTVMADGTTPAPTVMTDGATPAPSATDEDGATPAPSMVDEEGSTGAPTTEKDDNGTTGTASTSKQDPWPFEESDIPLDPKISYGELDNGLRYYFMPNNEPPGQVQLRLHVDIGANGEADDERGMAHFLEHMAFRSTKTFPKGTDMDRAFQALGIDFGTHINAYTNFEETVYYMGMPEPEDSTLDLAFSWMRDVLDGMELYQDELDVERQVVISEMEARDSVNARLWRETLTWLMPDHLISERGVIGTYETLSGLTREMFTNFYEQYYVPRRTTFVVVGDINATKVEAKIEEWFASLVDTGDRGTEPDYGTLVPGRGLQSQVYVDNEQRADELYIDASRNYDSVPDTIDKRIYDFQINLANSIVSRRIQDLPNVVGANITWGGATRITWYQSVVEPYIYVYPKDGVWRDAVANAEQELRRAMLYGFNQAEVDEVVANTLNSYEQAVASQDGYRSTQLADQINDSVNGRYVMSSPEENLRIFNLARDDITTESLHNAFTEYWNTTDIFLYLYAESLDVTEEEAAVELKELYLQSQQVDLDPPVESEGLTWAYTDFGTPGTVVSDSTVEDLEIRQMVLSNGVRVNMKKTDFQEDLIYVVARFGTGMMGQPKQTFLDEFTDYMITWGGIGEYNWRDLDRVLAGKTAGTSMSVTDGAFTFSGTTNPDDLELQLQLMAAHFTDPAYRDEALRWWVDEAPAYIDYFQYTLDGTYYYDVLGWLKGGDERFIEPTEEEMFAFEASDASDWLNPHLNSSYLEISLVGDLDDEAAIESILKTFGALSQRDETPPVFTDADRAIDIPQGPQFKTFTYESKIPQAAQMVVWQIPAVTGEDISLSRKLDLLAEIMSWRVFEYIREALGATYSPSAWSSESTSFDYGVIIAYVEGIPEELELFDDAIMLIANNITTNLISEDELAKTKAPYQTRVDENRRSNSYWLYNVLEESQAKPFHLDWFREREDHYASVTAEEINALAQEYLTEDRALHISILPVNGTETALS